MAKRLYVVEAMTEDDREDYLCKVGISKNPETRVRHLQSGSPHKLVLMNSVKSGSAKAIEQQLHTALTEYREPGGAEWFRVPGDVFEALCAIRDYPDINERLNISYPAEEKAEEFEFDTPDYMDVDTFVNTKDEEKVFNPDNNSVLTKK